MELIPSTFATTDFSLAMLLISAGVPLVNRDGQPIQPGDTPEWRQISSKVLDEKGWTLQDAINAGYEGEISYGFGKHDQRKDMIDAFRKTSANLNATQEIPDVIEVKDSEGRAVQIPCLPLLATFAAILFKNRKRFANRRKKVLPRLHIQKADGNYVILDPRADQKTKDHFGV